MAHGSPLDVLREELDTLANVDAFGNPVPTARFMGGREYAAICGADRSSREPSAAIWTTVLASGTLAIPSFADQGGPFREQVGHIVGNVSAAPPHRAALAALYCALMTDYCVTMLEARGDIILEGRLASNEAFASALAALREPQQVLRSPDETGTLRGAVSLSLIARGKNPQAAALVPCSAGPVGKLRATRDRWRSLLPPVTREVRSRSIPRFPKFAARRGAPSCGRSERRGRETRYATVRANCCNAKQAEQVDVRDRVASAPPTRDSEGARGDRMKRRRGAWSAPWRRAGCTVDAMKDIHETTCACASRSPSGSRPASGKGFGEVEEDRGDLGQRAAVDQRVGTLPSGLSARKAAVRFFFLRQGNRTAFERGADLVERDVRRHGARASGEVER